MPTMLVENCGLVEYQQAWRYQLDLVQQLYRDPDRQDRCLVLEHPAVFTIGRNGSAEHVGVTETFLKQCAIELLRVERGGEVTYHGPGQLVCYPIVNLGRRGFSLVEFVRLLETIMIDVAAAFGIDANRDPRNHGIWIKNRKLGSVGIAIRHSISFHGFALNVNPDLQPYSWINPCGLSGVSMTSMERECGAAIALEDVRQVMIATIEKRFGQVEAAEPAVGEPGRDARSSSDQAQAGAATRPAAKPPWLKKRLPTGAGYEKTRRLIGETNLHTVCREAHCPNQFECYSKGTATFMIMGDNCTRNCRFCAVAHGAVKPLDPEEPMRIAAAVAEMGLDYAVLTSVTRDDLVDGGAGHFAETIQAVRDRCPETLVEVLISDLQGNLSALEIICRRRPAVLNHNIETVPSLYPVVRPQARYRRSLDLLAGVKQFDLRITTKSGLMVGLGEERAELVQTMRDIRAVGCEILTIGQYLQPTRDHLAVKRFVSPEEFAELYMIAENIGFAAVASGPHVRSSYRAGHLYRSLGATVST